MLGWHYEVQEGRSQVVFSSRSHAGYDCSALARHHGGGGHRAAAGFRLSGDQHLGRISSESPWLLAYTVVRVHELARYTK